MVVMASDGIAQPGSPSQFGTVAPIQPSPASMSPRPGVYSQIQISATTADGMTKGAKNASRKNHRARPTRSASSAKTKPSTRSGGPAKKGTQTVGHSESQNSLLPSASR